MKNEKLYAQILSSEGVDAQSDQAVEEMAEAIVALKHWRRGRVTFEKVIEELTHVDQMIKQMKYLANIIHCQGVWRKEQRRTMRRCRKLLAPKEVRQ